MTTSPSNPVPAVDQAKQQARALRSALAAQGTKITHSAALELIAAQHGLANWNVLAATAPPAAGPAAADPAPPAAAPRLAAPIPVLRIFDADLARQFYGEWLGFQVDWEHRFAPDLPLYVQMSRDACVLHLSQHYGDASPGGTAFIWMTGVAALHAELHARPHAFMRPGLEECAWGTELGIIDPFSNRLRFCEAV